MTGYDEVLRMKAHGEAARRHFDHLARLAREAQAVLALAEYELQQATEAALYEPDQPAPEPTTPANPCPACDGEGGDAEGEWDGYRMVTVGAVCVVCDGSGEAPEAKPVPIFGNQPSTREQRRDAAMLRTDLTLAAGWTESHYRNAMAADFNGRRSVTELSRGEAARWLYTLRGALDARLRA